MKLVPEFSIIGVLAIEYFATSYCCNFLVRNLSTSRLGWLFQVSGS